LYCNSLESGTNFQVNAYNKALEGLNCDADSATYLLILDIDEYLTPRDFESNIKTLINKSPSVDVFSFLWYSDDFREDGAMAMANIPFRAEANIYRMNHVKSMAKISQNLISCYVHCFEHKNGYSPVYQFAGFEDTPSMKHGVFNGGHKLEPGFLRTLNPNQPESWFILHCIYRTKIEYLASLVRGQVSKMNKKNSDLLKRNRWGRKPCPAFPFEAILFGVSRNKLKQHRNNYASFIKSASLRLELLRARRFVINLSKILEQMVQQDPTVKNNYFMCFQGTKYSSANIPLTEEQIMNNAGTVTFDDVHFFEERPDVLDVYNLNDPFQSVSYAYEMNKFYGADHERLQQFSQSEFGYWHTKYFCKRYEKKGQGGDYWKRSYFL